MSPTDEQSMERRISTLEEAVKGIREDLNLQRQAWNRRTKEFHDLELAVNSMTTTAVNAREAEARQYRRLEVRVQVLTLAIGLGSIASPIAIALAVHG